MHQCTLSKLPTTSNRDSSKPIEKDEEARTKNQKQKENGVEEGDEHTLQIYTEPVVDLASQTKVDRMTVVNSHKDITNNQLEHSRPTVDCYIKSIKVTALLDACSTGPTSYVVNYIHPKVVEKIRKLEQDSKKKIMYECTCPRATTCTPAGCFETATCVTVDVQLSDLQSKTEVVRTSFRASVGIKDDIIIGNHTFKDLHLIDTFRHLFINQNRHSTSNEVENQII